jgi:hypothetical protein
MAKRYLFFIILIFFIGLGILFSQFKFIFLQKPQSIVPPSSSEKPSTPKVVEELETKEEVKQLFRELLGYEPPPFYEERLKGFLIKKQPSTFFIQNILIFPFPIYPEETLNFLLFLNSPPEKVKRLIVIIDFKDGNSTTTKLAPINVVQINNEEGVVWAGTIESFLPPSFATSSSPGRAEYLLIFKAIDVNDQILDEITLPLLMNF